MAIDPTFLSNGKGMGALIRAHDWSRSPLGEPSGWPQSLRSVVSLLLNSEFPMFVAWGEKLGFLYNDRYAEILGSKHPGALGRPFREIWGEIWSDISPLIDAALKGESTFHEDLPLRINRQGFEEQTWFTFSYSPALDEAGRVVGMFCTCSETTHAVLAAKRQALLAKVARALLLTDDPRRAMDAAIELLGVHLGANRVGYGEIQADDATGVLSACYADGVASLQGEYRLEGFGAESIANQRRGATESCDDIEGDPAQDPAVWRSIDTRAFASVPLVRNGRFVASLYVNFREPHRWTKAELDLIEEVASHTWAVVERARAQAELRALNETLEARIDQALAERKLWGDVVESSDARIAALSPSCEFMALNRAFVDAFERIYGPRPRVGDRLDALLAPFPEHGAQVLTLWRRALSGEPFTSREEFGDPARDRPCWEVRFNPLRDKDGTLIGAFVYATDVTEQRRSQAELEAAREALRQSQKMEAVGQLTGGIAHDFNNLLASISGSLQVLKRRLERGQTHDLGRYIETGESSVRRAAALTQRLLAFSRRQTLDPKPVNANRLVSSMEDLIRRTVGPSIELEVVGAGGLWITRVDPSQLENVLLNLCINARDAMLPLGGRLTIETANKWLDDRSAARRELPPGQYVTLSVTDTGTGIAPEIVKRIFDPFFTTKPTGQGTGLGLSMVYGFARQSDGQVRVYTELGHGTTMSLYLPRHVGEDEADSESAHASEFAQGDGETVVVVEDEEGIRMLVVEVLEEAGYRVLQAPDGPAGLRILQTHARIDLLVSDVGLPGGLNGRQVADAGRALRPELKVLFLTGYAENAAVGNGLMEVGMQVMTKPFDIEGLTNKVREMLKTRD